MTTFAMQGWARHPWKLPVLAGTLLAFGYFTLGLVVPNLAALVPLLVWIDANLDRPWRFWWRGGLAFGTALNLLILSWMRSMLAISFLGIFAYLGLTLVFAAGLGALVSILAWLRKRTGWSFVLLLPACWLSLEWLQAHGDLRMSAQHIGQSMAGTPFLVQFADLAGPYGVGLVLLLSNALIYQAWRETSRSRRAAVAAAWVLLAASVVSYDAWAWSHPPEARGHVTIGFVQPNIPLLEKMDDATDAVQSRLLLDLTRRAAGMNATVVIWPETAWPKAMYHRPELPATYVLPDVQALAKELGITIVAGAEYMRYRTTETDLVYNAAFVVHPDGRIDPLWAAKVYLVPFVEAVPFPAILGPFLSGRGGWMRWLGGGFSPGPKDTPLPVAGTSMGVSICYEELFFELQRGLRNAGASIQTVITNDAWFGTTFFQTYQANTVRMRAIENRSAFVRVANSGISMFVDPLGRDAERTELETQDVRVATLPLAGERTLYDRIGDVPAWAALALLAAAVLRAWRRMP
jgi:apolipoprotein N-acyltransferase